VEQDVVDDKEGDLVATPIALEAYYEAFAGLAKDHPECWHLCQRAEDRCRAEHFPRLARKIAASLGREATWSEVFAAAAEDDRYWDKEVRRPALSFLARGKRQSSEAADSRPEKKKPKHLDEKPRDRSPAGKGGKNGKSNKGGKGEHPRKDRKGKYLTSKEGKEICFRYANGGRTDCAEPCTFGRMHVCQICLQSHPNKSCPKAD
jgi:hypothetical protein